MAPTMAHCIQEGRKNPEVIEALSILHQLRSTILGILSARFLEHTLSNKKEHFTKSMTLYGTNHGSLHSRWQQKHRSDHRSTFNFTSTVY